MKNDLVFWEVFCFMCLALLGWIIIRLKRNKPVINKMEEIAVAMEKIRFGEMPKNIRAQLEDYFLKIFESGDIKKADNLLFYIEQIKGGKLKEVIDDILFSSVLKANTNSLAQLYAQAPFLRKGEKPSPVMPLIALAFKEMTSSRQFIFQCYVDKELKKEYEVGCEAEIDKWIQAVHVKKNLLSLVP